MIMKKIELKQKKKKKLINEYESELNKINHEYKQKVQEIVKK